MSDDVDRSESWLDLLYREFLLRDIFGKVVPGLILILALFAVATSPEDVMEAARSLEWHLLIVATGAAWLFGFAVQSLGEFLRFVRYVREPRVERRGFLKRQCWRLTSIWEPKTEDDAKKEGDHLKSAYERYERIWKNDRARGQRHVERLLVIKEACGNGACSLAFSLVIVGVADALKVWVFRNGEFSYNRVMVAVVVLICAVALWRMHWKHIYRQRWFEDVLLKSTPTEAEPTDKQVAK